MRPVRVDLQTREPTHMIPLQWTSDTYTLVFRHAYIVLLS